MSWGRNTYGNLGNGTTTNSSIPVQVNGLTNVEAVACGTNYSLALDANDSLFAFGRNTNGQLGNGTTADTSNPAAVLSLCTITIGSEDSNHFSNIKIVLYPNPARDFLVIEINENAIIEIFNLQGQIVKNTSLINSQNIININDLKSGEYLVTIRTSNEIILKKLIKY